MEARICEVDAFHSCEQQVIMVISEQVSGPWLLSGVYASTKYSEWRRLWHEISRLVT